MLIDELLLPVGFQHDGEAVKAPHDAAHLKAVHKKERYALSVFAGLVEEKVLQILCFLHDKSSLSPGSPAL